MGNNWNNLSLNDKSAWMEFYLRNGIKSLPEMISTYNKFAEGGDKKNKSTIDPYNYFLSTLPTNLANPTDDYNMRRYWELNGSPKDFQSAPKGMFSKQEDGYHANSVAYNNTTGNYEFMKKSTHPTYGKELEWYYSDDPEAVEFRKNYKYTPGVGMIPDQYARKYPDGGNKNNTTNQSSDKEPRYVSKYASEWGWMPEVNITATRPEWQNYLNDADLLNLKYGRITPETAKSIAEKRRTGTSIFMKDTNKLARIPNAAVGAIGAVPLTAGLTTSLIPTSIPQTVSLITSTLGGYGLGEGVNKTIKKASNNKYNNFGELVANITNRPDNTLAYEFLNPGYFVGGIGGDLLGRATIKTSRPIIASTMLNKSIKNANLNLTPQENSLHNRFKLGDVEINDPNLYYRQVDKGTISRFHNPQDGSQFAPVKSFTQEELDNMSIAKRFKARLSNGLDNPMYAQGKLWYGIPDNQSSHTELLVTNKKLPYSNKHSKEVSDKIRIEDYTTKPFYPDESVIVGSRRADIYGILNPTNTKTYEFLPNYGYKQVYPSIEPIPNALDIPIVMDEIQDIPISMSHTISNDNLLRIINKGKEKVIPYPSIAIGNPIKWRDNSTTLFLGNEIPKDFKLQYWKGDANTPLISTYLDPANIINMSSEDFIRARTNLKEFDKLLGDFPTITESVRNIKDGITSGTNTYNEAIIQNILPLNKVKYVFTENPNIDTYFNNLGIKTNFDYYENNPDLYNNLDKYIKEVVLKDKNTRFKNGGKLK